MWKNRLTQRGAVSIILWGLASMMVLGLVPALISPGLVHTSAPVAAPPTAAPGPSVTPYQPLPSHAMQLQMVPPPGHVQLGKFHLNGPRPSSWSGSGIPPGWEALQAKPNGWGSGGGGGGGGSTASNWNTRFCAGLWPEFQN